MGKRGFLAEGGERSKLCASLTWRATQIFKQEEFEGMFIEQVERLEASGLGAMNGDGSGRTGNGGGNVGIGSEYGTMSSWADGRS